MKVAVIGGGISGLTAAYRLEDVHEVVLFEADSRLGGHAHTVDVETGSASLAVDTGFIVYNETTYPRFIRLLDELGVETNPSDMSFGISCERTGIEWASHGLRSFLARPANVLDARFRAMARDIFRFNREAPAWLPGADEKVTLRDWLAGRRYSDAFSELYLLPMGASIWSASPDRFLEVPAATIIRFFQNHQLLQTSDMLPWRTIAGGSRRYVEALGAALEGRVRRSDRVTGIRRTDGGVEVSTSSGRLEDFDRVILATHSDQALALLDAPTHAERRVLSAIRYQENEAVLHTDDSLLARRPGAWASWNYRVPAEATERVLVTYDMTRLQSLDSDARMLVTLNPEGRIDEGRVISRQTYHHPVFDQAAIEAQQAYDQLDGAGGIHYAGAYWRYGFHEDGVFSGERAAERVVRSA